MPSKKWRPFTYNNSPVKEGQIRLLRFEKRNCDKISLRFTDSVLLPSELDEAEAKASTPYITLSYVWGAPGNPHTIFINDCTFEVGHNLFLALTCLEKEFEHPIWIDALCINQEDSEEKGIQVSQMGKVYSCSWRTIIFLGDAIPGTTILFVDFSRMYSDVEEAIQARSQDGNGSNKYAADVSPQQIRDELVSRLDEGHLSICDDNLRTLRQLTYSPWFGRTWIIQELCLSKSYDFMCGKHLMEGDMFRACMHLYNYHCLRASGNRLASLNVWDAITYHLTRLWNTHLPYLPRIQESMNLSTRASLTLGTRSYNQDVRKSLKHCILRSLIPTGETGDILGCTVEKDRIYAFLSIAGDALDLDIKPRYEKSVAWQDVYADATKRMILRGHVDLLCYCHPPRHSGPRDAELPSWCPDYSRELPVTWVSLPEDNLYSAWSYEPYPTQICDNIDQNRSCLSHNSGMYSRVESLDIEAVYVGKISRMKEARTEKNEYISNFARLGMVCELVLEPSCRYSTVQEKYDAAWRTPIFNRELDDSGNVVRATEAKSRAEYKQIIQTMHSRWPGLHMAFSKTKNVGYLSMMDTSQDTVPFITDNGYVGMCNSDDASVDDQIWIPKGSHVPFVFRKIGENRYTNAGPAYVHGIMHGQFFESSIPNLELITLEPKHV